MKKPRKGLTLTLVVFEFCIPPAPMIRPFCLTLTLVVFEYDVAVDVLSINNEFNLNIGCI